jgi:hypothetical protein
MERINQAIEFNKKHNSTDVFTVEQWERRRKKTGDKFLHELVALGFDIPLSNDEWLDDAPAVLVNSH